MFGQAVICAHISVTLVCLCCGQSGREGVSEGGDGRERRRRWCESVAKYHFIL